MFLSHNNASLSLCQINKPLLGLGFLKNHFIHVYLCTFSPHSHFALGSTNYATFPDHFLPYFLNQNKQASGTFSFLFILIFRKGNTCCFLIMVSLSFSSTSVLLDYITFSIPANIFQRHKEPDFFFQSKTLGLKSKPQFCISPDIIHLHDCPEQILRRTLILFPQ